MGNEGKTAKKAEELPDDVPKAPKWAGKFNRLPERMRALCMDAKHAPKLEAICSMHSRFNELSDHEKGELWHLEQEITEALFETEAP